MDNQEKFIQLLEEALTIQSSEGGGCDAVDEVNTILSSATKLVESSGKPDEAVVDAKVLSVSTNVLANCVIGIDGNLNAFDVSLFADSILSFINVETPNGVLEDWTRLHIFTNACCKQTVSLDYMLGTFTPGELQPKKRKERATRQAESKEPVVKPKNVTVGEKQEDGIEESLHIIMKVLLSMYRRNNNKPVCYFKLVIDPESFSATIENMYHVSFLVKDGVVRLALDDDGLPVISPAAKESVSAGKKKTQGYDDDSNQCIIAMNMSLWKEVVETFDITRARIPRRDNLSKTTSQNS